MLKDVAVALGIGVSALTIVSLIAAKLGQLIEQKKKEDAAHAYLMQNAHCQQTLMQHTLRLTFAIGNEMVKQGANGELKKAVNDLRDIVIAEAMPQEDSFNPPC